MKYAVIDQKRDVYAIASSVHSLRLKVEQAQEYLEEARTCGHALAKRWVEERLPLNIVELEDDYEGTHHLAKTIPLLDRLDIAAPILDREP